MIYAPEQPWAKDESEKVRKRKAELHEQVEQGKLREAQA